MTNLEARPTAVVCADGDPVAGIVTANDVARELDDLYDNGIDRGLEIGFPDLDQHYRIKPGYMSIVTGIPSHGKSGVVDQIIVKLAEAHGWTFTIFSPEQQPVHKHIQHLIELHAGEPMLQGPRERMSRETMHAARQWVGDHFSVLDDRSVVDPGVWRAVRRRAMLGPPMLLVCLNARSGTQDAVRRAEACWWPPPTALSSSTPPRCRCSSAWTR